MMPNTMNDQMSATEDGTENNNLKNDHAPEAIAILRRLFSNGNIFSYARAPSMKPTVNRRHDPYIPTHVALNPTKSPTTHLSTYKPYKSAKPSKSPNSSPPTFAATGRPHSQRTRLPTSSPTQSIGIPSQKPTSKPSSKTTKPVDTHQNATSTNAPTRVSSPSPTRPTFVSTRTYHPTISKFTDNPCTLLSDGTFGTTDQLYPHSVLTFDYQLETNLSSFPDIEILVFRMERAISRMLLQNMFLECQSTSNDRDRRILNKEKYHFNQTYHRILSLQGISSLPMDIIQSGVRCPSPLFNTNNTCIVVNGGLTLYGNLTWLDDRQTAYNLIQDGMITGSLKNANSSIVRLTYLGNGNTTVSGPTVILLGSGSSNMMKIAVIASSLFVFISILFVARRYVSKRHKDILKQQGDDRHDDSMHLLEIRIHENNEEDCTGLLHELVESPDGSNGDSVSTSTDDGFYHDSSEVIVLNELGEELWLSLAETKAHSDNASCSLIASDHSSVYSQTFDAWLYSDDSTFV